MAHYINQCALLFREMPANNDYGEVVFKSVMGYSFTGVTPVCFQIIVENGGNTYIDGIDGVELEHELIITEIYGLC
jgi:hypothetical protein